MDRRSPVEGWRAAALAVALFAITLNFLQPLAHAALMRSGGPSAWAAICKPGAVQDDQGSGPAAQLHDCCIGLAHAPVLAAPPTEFILVERLAAIALPPQADPALAPVGIRDGPSQPRGPPLPV
ncbi:DUF2946 family protein [Reyranella sp.]|uniref:DUF2946 family protein n=1 Tax=Reyranella sp. TaxID=1929291 RepID=UPI003BAB20E2